MASIFTKIADFFKPSSDLEKIQRATVDRVNKKQASYEDRSNKGLSGAKHWLTDSLRQLNLADAERKEFEQRIAKGESENLLNVALALNNKFQNSARANKGEMQITNMSERPIQDKIGDLLKLNDNKEVKLAVTVRMALESLQAHEKYKDKKMSKADHEYGPVKSTPTPEYNPAYKEASQNNPLFDHTSGSDLFSKALNAAKSVTDAVHATNGANSKSTSLDTKPSKQVMTHQRNLNTARNNQEPSAKSSAPEKPSESRKSKFGR